MSTRTATLGSVRATYQRRELRLAQRQGQWWRFVILLLLTAIAVIPIASVIYLSFRPGLASNATGFTFQNFHYIFTQTAVATWLKNSLLVTAVTVVVSVCVAAPAGYVISRGRNRAVSGFALILFIVQSLPVVTAVIPLFILFAKLGLVDNLIGVMIIYVGATMSVVIWMMGGYYDSIPMALEEAAWIDGASVFGGFVRIVLRNSLPGVLSAAIFAFLLAWNDYLVALVFLRSAPNFTFPIGLESFFQEYQVNWGPVSACAVIMMLPPIVLFAVLNRYFSIGGIGGSLAGR